MLPTTPTAILVTLGVMPVVMTVKRAVRPSIFCVDTVALSKMTAVITMKEMSVPRLPPSYLWHLSG